MLIEVSLRSAGFQIENNTPIPIYAIPWRDYVILGLIEPRVAHIAMRKTYVWWESVGSRDRVVRQVDTIQLWTPRRSVGHSRGCRLIDPWCSGVKNPKGVIRGYEERLNTDKRVLHVATERNPIGDGREASCRCVELEIMDAGGRL